MAKYKWMSTPYLSELYVSVEEYFKIVNLQYITSGYPTVLKGCRGIVFTHGVRMGGWAVGKSLCGLYLRNRKV